MFDKLKVFWNGQNKWWTLAVVVAILAMVFQDYIKALFS
jgi:hypothetical protein